MCPDVAVESTEQGLVVSVVGNATRQPCPNCGYESKQWHSTYVRALRNLPVQGRCVRIRLIVRRWRCLNRACSRKTFSQAFGGFAKRYAQRTERMSRFMEHLILNISSNTGAYLAQLLGMEVSPRTLLRCVDHGEVQARTPRVLGI
jgi:transposase